MIKISVPQILKRCTFVIAVLFCTKTHASNEATPFGLSFRGDALQYELGKKINIGTLLNPRYGTAIINPPKKTKMISEYLIEGNSLGQICGIYARGQSFDYKIIQELLENQYGKPFEKEKMEGGEFDAGATGGAGTVYNAAIWIAGKTENPKLMRNLAAILVFDIKRSKTKNRETFISYYFNGYKECIEDRQERRDNPF